MTRRHLITAAGVLGWVVAAHAAATWQSKPYYTWTDIELKEVLTDSPWADKGTITYFVPAGGAPKGGTPQAIEDVALVSWVSALPLRQAGVRQQIPVGVAPPKETEDALAQPAGAYVLAMKVYGGNGSSGYANGTKVMQPETFLLREGKPPIAAIQSEGKALDKDDKVIETPAPGPPRGAGGGGAPQGGLPANGPFFSMQRGGGGGGGFGGGGGGFGAPQAGGANRPRGAASLLVYVFPKTDAITAADKEVDFSSKLCTAAFGARPGAPEPSPTATCRFNVKKKFKLKDMVYNGALAL